MMTRKHFEFIAEVIRATEMDRGIRDALISALAEGFEEFNPLFDADKFAKAATN